MRPDWLFPWCCADLKKVATVLEVPSLSPRSLLSNLSVRRRRLNRSLWATHDDCLRAAPQRLFIPSFKMFMAQMRKASLDMVDF